MTDKPNNDKLKKEKLKALEATLGNIEKAYGKGSIMKLGDEAIDTVSSISSGSISLDHALGIGGVPKGRVVEIFGPEASGKTTLALHIIAEAQKKGGIAAFIDAEHAFDRMYAEKLGIDTQNLLISQPDHGEQALEIADSLIRSAAIDVVVIDSVAALTPKSEIDGEMGDSKMGLHARLMSQALRKLTANISKTGTVCIFINQLREKIGVMFGNPETTTGGNALKFYASVRIDIRRTGQIKDGDTIKGNRVRVKVVKNKVAPPFRKAEFDIIYGEGISKIGEIVDLGVDYNIVKKSGSWFSYGDTKLGQGRDAVKSLLMDNPDLVEDLENKINEAIAAE
ncbi:MAG: recombinase RecA [Lentimicrobiaceae bacterium]|jgi:recombination protein RecA|nr:recombinase RecA [Lentimicrobiaceae bacterium]MCP4910348.1 recombinase RecA [Bacteroidota bacterium]MBT3454262.1 recombinase RecA [Lentimicrobiaceae bacterium]MBT3817862.1 recombinase RecA [Lentimicrobiaceae bacterium]MBT4060691.1 recombinase RecA [Lentimicrobiaceae bacterium]